MKKDEKWKSLISKFLKDFLSFFMPELHQETDFEKGYEFLDGELNRIKIKSKSKNRRSDKLVKVYLKDGTEKYILIHIEVQGYFDEDFSKRMFKYFYRISDLHDTYDITSIAVFTDADEIFKPSQFDKNLFGTELTYKYNTYKVLEQKEKELKKSDNIFAFVILATLYSLKAKEDQKKKLKSKVELTKILFKKNYTEDNIMELFEFINLFLNFKSQKFDELFYMEVEKMPKVKEKEVLNSFERFLFNKGKKENSVELVKIMILENEPLSKIIKYTGLSKDEVEKIINKLPRQEKEE